MNGVDELKIPSRRQTERAASLQAGRSKSYDVGRDGRRRQRRARREGVTDSTWELRSDTDGQYSQVTVLGLIIWLSAVLRAPTPTGVDRSVLDDTSRDSANPMA
ncbi:hypothetical protein O181_056488 [Austropuccinia psidii MF-1]|uniref:Uncharacterized protein n=1 Tax=Austropuccinia psidii MF-1 TaxID=1389203 RepID=A0A9Q3HTH6_9BASI|nr:hypothetical protein [Austropuccinia psidii MF-1]